MVLPDGSTYNPFELMKCEKIAEYYDLEWDVVEVRLDDEELKDFWDEKIADKIFDNQLYGEIMINHFRTADYIIKNYN